MTSTVIDSEKLDDLHNEIKSLHIRHNKKVNNIMNQKYKVKADIKQLQAIGIDYNITGKIGSEVAVYGDWIIISLTHYVMNMPFVNEFDIPKQLLEKL